MTYEVTEVGKIKGTSAGQDSSFNDYVRSRADNDFLVDPQIEWTLVSQNAKPAGRLEQRCGRSARIVKFVETINCAPGEVRVQFPGKSR